MFTVLCNDVDVTEYQPNHNSGKYYYGFQFFYQIHIFTSVIRAESKFTSGKTFIFLYKRPHDFFNFHLSLFNNRVAIFADGVLT